MGAKSLPAAAALLLLVAAAPAPPDPAGEYAARAAKLEGQKDPKAWLKLADFCEENRLWDRRLEALRKAVSLSPDHAEAHARLDEARSGNGWKPADEVEAAEQAENEAKGLTYYGNRWVLPKDADKLRQEDRKAEGWDLSFRLDTPRLRIYSGRTLPFTRRLAALLESEIDAYLRFYRGFCKPDPKPQPFKVYVFPDRGTFVRVVRPVWDSDEISPSSDGYYAPATKILYVGIIQSDDNKETDEAYFSRKTVQVALHEMLHALDDQVAHRAGPTLPIWVAEGRADHFGYAACGRQVLPGIAILPPGDPRPRRLEEGLAHLVLPEFLALDRKAFYEGPVLEHYAMAWAFVHFLWHGEGGKHAEPFRQYLKGLPAKGGIQEFETTVGKAADLEAPFRAYVKDTLLPEARASQ